ncbi:MAG: hypothetical protein JST26_01785 [Bacteroidetes bacterium]|nr:hypothetical protein [Bacteroidota bacterium]
MTTTNQVEQKVCKHETTTIRTESRAAAKTAFVSGRVTRKLGALCFYLSSGLVDSFVLRETHPNVKPKIKKCNK